MTSLLLLVGLHRAELDLRYSFIDKGTMGHHREDHRVKLALEIARDGKVTLRANEDTWNGEIVDDTIVFQKQTFRCAVTLEKKRRVLRCDPTVLRQGFAWNDPLPAYMRVPLVVAVDGTARTFIDVVVPAGNEVPGPPMPVRIEFPTSGRR